jgi:hypothetical protein
MDGEPEGVADNETSVGADAVIAYPGVYSDVEGEERVTLRSDGRTLQLTVRGPTCLQESFDDLFTQPEVGEQSTCLHGYTGARRIPIVSTDMARVSTIPILTCE